MMASLRLVILLVATASLSACQQAVRPNLMTMDSLTPPVAAPMPEPLPVSGEATPVVVDKLEASTEVAAVDPSAIALMPGRGQDVFDRINSQLGQHDCAEDATSKRWRQRYASNPAAFAQGLEQILPLMDFVSTEVERAGLPAEFVFIPLVESWYKPGVIGPGGPAGMWQMISSTARNHGIHIQPGYDGRLSPVESTRAALSYLKTLQGMFGDWQAIVMAYNAGEGRMLGAFKRAKSRDVSAARRKPHGLSNITYDYVSRLQALACLIAQPGKAGLNLPVSAQFVPLAPVLMDVQFNSLDQFAASQGLDSAELKRLNPGYKGGHVVAGVPRLVLMPFVVKQTPIEPLPTAIVDPLIGASEAPKQLP